MSDLIQCDGCGRSFTTDHAAQMLDAIKGPCPTCGGTFHLASAAHTTATPPSARPPSAR